MAETSAPIQFALISHSDSGRAALSRILAGLDAGERAENTLQLWEPSGFDDTARLQKRLAVSGNPVGWFLREVVDRYRERPLWQSQQAMRAARDATDLSLYLLDAADDPQTASYLAAELKILAWLGKPVIVLLNRRTVSTSTAEADAQQSRWCEYLQPYPIVRATLALDSFARCWLHEQVFHDTVRKFLTAPKQTSYARLLEASQAAYFKRYAESMQLTANQLVAAVQDNERITPEETTLFKTALQAVGLMEADPARHDRAMNMLAERLNLSIVRTTVQLLLLHKHDRNAAASINARVRECFTLHAPVVNGQAGLLGGLICGAVAEALAANSLPLSAGLVDELTPDSAEWGFKTHGERSEPVMEYSDDFMRTLLVAGLLRYLAVSHFGCGYFAEEEIPARWQEEVEAAIALHDSDVCAMWRALRQEPNRDKARFLAAETMTNISLHMLHSLYPDSVLPG